MRAELDQIARDLQEQGLRLNGGGLRIHVHLRDGIVEVTRVSVFRVPAGRITFDRPNLPEPNHQLLEKIARELGLGSHRQSELMVEYSGDDDARPRLRLVDFSYST